MQTSDIKTDFLIIGGGIAGLRAALGASRYGKVCILNKGLKSESSSEFAQGGVAAALNEEEGGVQSHYQDTLDAGRGLCREEAVRVLVEEGPQRIHELIQWGAEFDKVGNHFALAKEGAHRHDRILRARGDSTGYEIVKTLLKAIGENKNISILNGQFAIDLFVTERDYRQKACRGAWVLDERSGAIVRFAARAVVLATGGAGQVYQRTTNPSVSTGDGIAMALQAGAELEDMAFFQFHPTALFLPAAPSFLISEALRGEGGRLLDTDGKAFMARYHPDAELAPRDLVARAIWNEIKMYGRQHVFLDMTHLKSAFVKERFPTIYTTCLRYGIDITCDMIPVAPSAHYMMGGVKTDLWGQTKVSGLYAVGEVAAAGVHGANRLASNSLLEGLVFGARVGEAVEGAPPQETTNLGQDDALSYGQDLGFSSRSLAEDLLVQKELKETLWHDVGIVRSEASLRRALDRCRQWKGAFLSPGRSRLSLETRNMLWSAAAIIVSALHRRESLGAHFREDFPCREEAVPPQHFLLTKDLIAASLQIDPIEASSAS